MVILVALANVMNIIPEDLKAGSKKIQDFFSKQFLLVVMVGVGIMLIIASVMFGIFF